jgi:hypothetical protein
MSEEATAAPAAEEDDFEWMMVEIFGHRMHYGRGKEVERFGSKMLRIDVPQVEWAPVVEGEVLKPIAVAWTTLFYGGASIFSNALTDEATVLKKNAPYAAPYRAITRQSVEPEDDDPF